MLAENIPILVDFLAAQRYTNNRTDKAYTQEENNFVT
jgi:hypothetical protein